MIKFRQKEYSSFSTKVLFRKNQLGNIGTKIKDKLPLTKKTALSRVGVMRKTIDQKNKIKYAKNLALTEPGTAMKNTIATVVENPVTIASAPTPLPTIIVNKVEKDGLKRIKPYDKVTKTMGEAVRKVGTHRPPKINLHNSSPLVSRWERFKNWNVPSALNGIEETARQGGKAVAASVPLFAQPIRVN